MAGKKSNYNKSGAAAAHKRRKQEEAIERQKAREKRTASQQMELVLSRPGNSKRESEKLQQALNSQSKSKK